MHPAIYFDNAASTPILPEVRDAMRPFFEGEFGNPSSAHSYGRAARGAIERARVQVANAVGASSQHVFFTSGGTEADNLGVLGGALAARAAGRPFAVAVSQTEHKAAHAAAHEVGRLGGTAIELRVDEDGVVDLEGVTDALATGTDLVAVMWVNNETGTVQHIRTIAERCAEAGAWLTCDAVQALGKIPCSVADLPRTMLAISGHKIGAPKGVGALVVPDRHAVHPLLHGGGQQGGVRPGTENVASIVGFGVAAELAARDHEDRAARLATLRDAFEHGLASAVPDAVIHSTGAARAPHISSVAFPGADGGTMLMHLDLAGVCCSGGSACATGAVAPSHVLTAMGVPRELAGCTLRFSFGTQNTMTEVETVLDQLPGLVAKVRDLGAVLRR